MALSVIVTSYESPAVLERCLESLAAQPEAAEIVVADCSRENPAMRLGGRFPTVKFLHFAERRAVPKLRWAALRQTSQPIVAAVEARCVPGGDWCAQLLAAYERHPKAAGVGGTVAFADWSSAIASAIYFAEYGSFAAPAEEHVSAELSGANLSYRREALEAHADLLHAGAWETLIHLRWRAAGVPLVVTNAPVTFVHTMKLGDTLRQRFSYGRGYAAARVGGQGWARRLAYALVTPALPLLFAWRASRSVGAKGLASRFVWALPWFLVFQAAWASGEATGYLLGPAAEDAIY